MKAIISFASAIACVVMGSSDSGPWEYKCSSGDDCWDKQTLYNFNDVKWQLSVQTAHDEDAGVEYIRFKHELEADIKATDVVTFEIAFLS